MSALKKIDKMIKLEKAEEEKKKQEAIKKEAEEKIKQQKKERIELQKNAFSSILDKINNKINDILLRAQQAKENNDKYSYKALKNSYSRACEIRNRVTQFIAYIDSIELLKDLNEIESTMVQAVNEFSQTIINDSSSSSKINKRNFMRAMRNTEDEKVEIDGILDMLQAKMDVMFDGDDISDDDFDKAVNNTTFSKITNDDNNDDSDNDSEDDFDTKLKNLKK